MSHHFESAVDIAAGVRSGEYDPVDVVESTIDRIADRGDVTNAFVTVTAESARADAREVAERLEAGEDLPLAGVPFALKDLADAKAGVRHTMGLEPLADNVATASSVAVQRLEAAGAVAVGTTNTPELGYTGRTDNRLQGPTATPFDPAHNAGGSSGGSAAALAEGLCALATGSDVGGSLRTPASCCGVVSVKPSFGLVPAGNRVDAFQGHTPFRLVGPMARDVESLALLLDVMAGPHRDDPFSVPTPTTYRPAAATPPDPGELRLAYSPDLSVFTVDPAVRETVEATLGTLESAGATVEDAALELPAFGELTHAFSLEVTRYFATTAAILEAEYGVDLAGADSATVPSNLVTMIGLGDSHDIGEYARSDFVRTDLYRAVEDALDGYDALVCPTLATPPLTHEEPYPTEIDGESTNGLETSWMLTWPFNMTGHPVVSVPAGRVDGLPVGMQLVGARYAEPTLLGAAAAIEATAPWTYPEA